jgi:hypothetical protein
LVAEDGNVFRSVRLSKTPPSSVHAEVANKGVDALLLKTAGKNRVALVEGAALGGVVGVELEEGVEGGVGQGGVSSGGAGANLLRRVDAAAAERSALVLVGY